MRKKYSWAFWVDVALTCGASVAFGSSLLGEQTNLTKIVIEAVCVLYCIGCTLFLAKKVL